MTAAISGSSGIATRSWRLSTGALALHRRQVIDVDAAPFAEQHDEDREPDRRLGRCHREHEEHEHLAVDVAEITGERHEVEVRGEEQELHAHEKENDVLAVEKNAGHGEREQDRRERQKLRKRDHSRFSGGIFTMRTRSLRSTDTWRLTF